MMTGETEADTGAFWKHPNMRIAYVAQHAFHHIEEHLEKTPLQYMQWRYAIGEDREGLMKVNRKVSWTLTRGLALGVGIGRLRVWAF